MAPPGRTGSPKPAAGAAEEPVKGSLHAGLSEEPKRPSDRHAGLSEEPKLPSEAAGDGGRVLGAGVRHLADSPPASETDEEAIEKPPQVCSWESLDQCRSERVLGVEDGQGDCNGVLHISFMPLA